MTKMAGVTQAKPPFGKNNVFANPTLLFRIPRLLLFLHGFHFLLGGGGLGPKKVPCLMFAFVFVVCWTHHCPMLLVINLAKFDETK